MKEIKDIERMLRSIRPPDQDAAGSRHEVWQHVLEERKQRQKPRSIFFRLRPWIWALASIILMLICIMFMIFIYRS